VTVGVTATVPADRDTVTGTVDEEARRPGRAPGPFGPDADRLAADRATVVYWDLGLPRIRSARRLRPGKPRQH
jgi:hypothetical protein